MEFLDTHLGLRRRGPFRPGRLVVIALTVSHEPTMPQGRLADAEMMARDLIWRRVGISPDAFAVAITPEIGQGIDEEIREAREAVRAADRARREAAAQSRRAARRLQQAGLSGRDIARVLDVTPQRVSQLLKAAP
jgi:hypothetical protein